MNNWTSVDNRLPKKTNPQSVTTRVVTAILYGKKYDIEITYMFYYDDIPVGFLLTKNITHWMPLPQPPSDEQEAKRHGWVRVSERLPEKNKKQTRSKSVFVAKLLGSGEWFIEIEPCYFIGIPSFLRNEKIKYWMPLPPPPNKLTGDK